MTLLSPDIPQACTLCPRMCGANRRAGEAGSCGASDTLRIARAALHAWEEPSISVRAGSGTVFFSHCPLRCVYCQNYDISRDGFGLDVTTERLADIFLELQEQDAGNINLVTGTHYIPWIVLALAQARSLGLRIPVVWNTSGYERRERIDSLAGSVDIYLTDCKYAPADIDDAAERYSHEPRYFEIAIEALDTMLAQVGEPVFAEDGSLQRGVIVRHLLLPGRLEASRFIVKYLYQRYGMAVFYSFMNQYTPVQAVESMPELNHTVADADYEELLDYADELGITEYYWQEGGAAQESFIPPFDISGVAFSARA